MELLKEAGLSFILTMGLLWLIVQLTAAQLIPKSLNWNLSRLQVEPLNYPKDEIFLKRGGCSSVTVSGLAHLLNLPLGVQAVGKTHCSSGSCSCVCIAESCLTKPCLTSSSDSQSIPLIPWSPRSSGFLACELPALYETCYPCQLQHSSYPVYQNTDFYLCRIIKYVPWGGMNPM